MPKKVYTLGDVKRIIAEKENVKPENVVDRCSLQGMDRGEVGWEELVDDSEMFEVKCD